MGITFGDHLIDSGYHDITPEQEREIEARETCEDCDGKGWNWRVPEGFNPFYASIEVTARAMSKAPCSCEEGKRLRR